MMSPSDAHASLQVAHCDEADITLAVCTNKLARHVANIESNALLRGPQDRALCVVDEDGSPTLETLERLQKLSIDVILNRQNSGLSFSRNTALQHCQTRFLLFLDDDVTIAADGLAALRSTIASGATAAGLRLSPPPELDLDVWFATPCQWHYLALHRSDRPPSVWGACMLIDVEAAHQRGAVFQDNLGRRGSQLQSGDDTTFLRLLEAGGKTIAVDDCCATHHIARDRIRFAYLLRRAYWQGVSELRRRTPWGGLSKEIKRNFDFNDVSIRKTLLALIYVGAVTAGLAVGALQALAAPNNDA